MAPDYASSKDRCFHGVSGLPLPRAGQGLGAEECLETCFPDHLPQRLFQKIRKMRRDQDPLQGTAVNADEASPHAMPDRKAPDFSTQPLEIATRKPCMSSCGGSRLLEE